MGRVRRGAVSLVPWHNGGYWHLLFCTSPSRLDYLLLIIGTTAAIAAGAPFPLLGILFGQLVDDFNSTSCSASQSANRSGLQASITIKVLLMVYIALANFAAIFIHTSCWSLFGERLIGRLRRQYFKSLLRQEMAFFDSLPAGEVPTRLTSDMEIVRAGTSEKVGIFISSFAYFIGAYIVAFFQVPKLAGMLTFMVPAYGLMAFVSSHYIGKYTGGTSKHLAAAASVVTQSLSNVALIHALGANRRLEVKLVSILSEVQKAALSRSVAAATQFGFMFLVAYAANALAFWQGSKEIAMAAEGDSNVTAGSVYTVIFVLLDASFVVSQVAPLLQIFGAATAASRELKAVANRTSRSDATSSSISDGLPLGSRTVSFKDVVFAYPSRPDTKVLKGVTLDLIGGKHTTIVGASGSGKSTIGGLMTRLYEPGAGMISLDGFNLGGINVSLLRQCIGTVDQDPALLSCSVLENIAFGDVSASEQGSNTHSPVSSFSSLAKKVREGQDLHSIIGEQSLGTQDLFERVVEAAVAADACTFIGNLQHGFATLIGPRGVQLSGGQKQRLALARALLRDPPILLLDEATSALDSMSEQTIISSLRESRKYKTTITIAHRLGTVKDADIIIVMHDGQVVDQGTHDELLATDGIYKAMIEAQSLQVSDVLTGESSEASTAISSMPSVKRPRAGRRISLKAIQRISYRGDGGGDKDPPESKEWLALRYFAKSARPQLLFVFVGSISAVIAGGAYSGDAVIFGKTIGNLGACHGASEIRSAGNFAGLLFFVLALAAFVANSIGGAAFGRVAEKVVCKIRILTFRSLLHQDLLWHTSCDRSPAVLLSYFTADTSALAGLSGVVVGTILTILVNLVASILMTHIIAWKIAIVLLATLPILLGAGFMRLYALARLQEKYQKLYATSADISLEAVASIKTIASLSIQQEFYRRYSRSLQGSYKATVREFAYTSFWLATAYSVSFLIYALAYWWGSKQIVAGTYSQTQFFIVLPALLFSAQSCGQMFALAPDVSSARMAATRLFGLIDSKGVNASMDDDLPEDSANEKDPEKALSSTSTPPSQTHQQGMSISLVDITFAYPNQPNTPILNSLALSISSGTFCALVGPSGSGKSTILSLLESLYSPTSGTITLDNTPISPTQRSSISLVPQSNTLFSDTVAFNIALGAHPAHIPSLDEIRAAAVAANIHDLIASLPQGYDTQCGASSASDFSGGQKQRLCIARALVRQPRLLLLDEPTSALDAEAERSLLQTIEGVRGRTTVVVVAHRLCTVRRADRIFWIEGGVCTHAGTHEELLVGCQGYRTAALLQAVG